MMTSSAVVAFFVLFVASISASEFGDDSFEKRAPFSSWAGKRAYPSHARNPSVAEILREYEELQSMNKRAPFSSWAGKRAPFSSWAGKRSSPHFNHLEDSQEVRGRYKRSSGEDFEDDDVEMHPRQRRGANSFSAWGGKRAELRRFTRNAPIESGLMPMRVLRPQRAAFSAWGGK